MTGDTASTGPVTVGAPFFLNFGSGTAASATTRMGSHRPPPTSSRHTNEVTSSTASGPGQLHPVASTTLSIHLASGSDADVTTAIEPVASAIAKPAASVPGSSASYACPGAFTDSAGARTSLPMTAMGTTLRTAVEASFTRSVSSSSSVSDRLLLAQSLVRSDAHGPLCLNSATEHSVDPSGSTGNGSGAVDFGSWPGRGIAARVRTT